VKCLQTKQDDDLARVRDQESIESVLGRYGEFGDDPVSLLRLPHCFAKFLEKMQFSV
jgi:hypothetical protein